MSRVDAVAQAGFDRGAADYESGRPGYPPEAVAIAADALRLGSGARVVDLAAGTGKLTRALAPLGAEIIAVEPVAGMRRELAAAVPGIEILDGTAEAIPLADGTVGAVFVAQAFHWFDVPAAAAEIARVLTPDGALVIVRNLWDDERAPWLADLRTDLHARIGRPARHDRNWADELAATGRFAPLQRRSVDNPVRADVDSLVRRFASLSFVAAMDDGPRAEVLAEVRGRLIASGRTAGEPFDVPTRTEVAWAQRR